MSGYRPWGKVCASKKPKQNTMNDSGMQPPTKAAKGKKEGRKEKNLAADVAALRADVDALKAALEVRAASVPATVVSAESEALEHQMRAALVAPSDAALVYAFAYRVERNDEAVATTSGAHPVSSLADVLRAPDERIARISYAFSSLPKVALVRSLLATGPQSAAQLGEKARLSTGSLYHHLRELVHAEVIHQTGRNQYALTPLGHQTALLLFALAGVGHNSNK